jgi:plastocyanin
MREGSPVSHARTHARTLARTLCIAVLVLITLVPATSLAEPRGRVDARTPRGTIPVEVVRMVDGDRFRPATLEVSRGTRVRWVNRDNVDHTTTSNDGLWSARLDPGEVFARRFRRAGEFGYRCTLHFGMRGTIVVS